MTPTQLLDEFGREISLEKLAATQLMWTIGPECRHTEPLRSTAINQPCNTCGIIIERRRLLFGSEQEILTAIYECYIGAHTRSVTLLLFSSLLERLTQRLLESTCAKANLSLEETKFLLKRCRYLEERVQVLDEMTGQSVVSKSLAPWIESYLKFKEDRNGLAHGKPWAHLRVIPSDCAAAVEMASTSFQIFAQLLGKLCCADSPSPQMPTMLK